ncbi:MAG: hypothetical protein R3F54_27025 [Alphaproteobacteria bacterium]
MQVAGRVAMMTLRAQRLHARHLRRLPPVDGAVPLMLSAPQASMVLLIGFVALQGAGYGATPASRDRCSLAAEQFGRDTTARSRACCKIAFAGGSAASPTLAALI